MKLDHKIEVLPTKTKYGTKIGVLHWEKRDCNQVKVYVFKHDDVFSMDINAIQLTDEICERLKIQKES